MELEKFVNLKGPLIQTYLKLKPETIQHAYEINNARRNDIINIELTKESYWTGDGAVYDKIKEIVYMTPRELNPLFNEIGKSKQQLEICGDYHVPEKEMELIVKSDKVIAIPLKDLQMKRFTEGIGFFEVNCEDYKALNPLQREIAEWTYGRGDDFPINMEMLKKQEINNVRINLLLISYLRGCVKDHDPAPIAMACGVASFGGCSDFSAQADLINHTGYYMRGELK